MASDPASKAQSYPYKVVLFGARQDIEDKATLKDSETIARFLAQEKYILVNGGSRTGLMGHTARTCHTEGGMVHGIGLHRYEPNLMTN